MSQPSFDLGFDGSLDDADDAYDDDGGLPTFTVGELAEALNGVLRRNFYDGVWVRGEIQGLNERGGHLYFSLTDDDEGIRATIAVSLFANVRFKLRPLLQRHRLRLADGMKVRLHGYLDFFAPNGRLSLKMSGIDPHYTLGELALQREELVRRLVAAGLYDAQARLPSPVLPLTVGLVTSIGSAAWHDVTHELEASGFGFRIVACDARVQGEWAPEMVAAAIRTLGRRDVDVVLVVRGGGARSDLATFDTEVVARAIATCPRPVLTGLGHEVDRSVADEVAHVALKTPTACAGDLIARVRQFRAELSRVWDAIGHAAAGRLAAADRSLAASTRQAARVTRRSVDAEEAGLRRAAQALARQSRLAATTSYALVDHDARRTAAASIRLLAHHSSALNASGQRLARRAPASARQAGRHLDAVDARVRALDPARTLARGWSITRTLDGHAVRSAGELAPGDTMVTSFVDGEVRSRVEEVDGP